MMAGSYFLRMNDGTPTKTVTGVFRGDICVYREDRMTRETYPADDPRGAFRFRINFVVNENGAMTAKIFNSSTGTHKALTDYINNLKAQGKDYTKVITKLTRTGQGVETTYTMEEVPQALTPQQLSALNGIRLLNLEPKSKTTTTFNDFGTTKPAASTGFGADSACAIATPNPDNVPF